MSSRVQAVAVVVAAVVVAAVIGAWALVVEPQQRAAIAQQVVASAVPTGPDATPAATKSAPTLKPVPAGSSVLFIGDSYTMGYGAGSEDAGYAPLLAARFGWAASYEAMGGTGYTWGGGDDGKDGADFLTRITKQAADKSVKPALVVLQGSQNDYRSEPGVIRSAAAKALAKAKAAWPGAQIVMLGPVAPYPTVQTLAENDSALAGAAAEAGVPYVSGLEWFTKDNTAQYGFSDGAHLNGAGHAYLADKTYGALTALTRG